MLAWQHLTTANQRIKLAKCVLSAVYDSDEEATGGRSGSFRYLTKYEK